MSHRNAPLSFEGRLRLVQRCQQRPISHVAAEMGISRACASKWVNRWRRHGELGLHDRPSTPHHSPDATPAWVIERIETWRREKKWSANRITHELAELDFRSNRHRHPPPDPTRAWSAQVHRPQRSQQPQARQDHRPLAGSHGTSGREEGRPDPRRRRVATDNGACYRSNDFAASSAIAPATRRPSPTRHATTARPIATRGS